MREREKGKGDGRWGSQREKLEKPEKSEKPEKLEKGRKRRQ